MDKIVIHRLQCYGKHGVLPEENALGQRFIADVELGLDLRPSGLTDNLARTVNYAEAMEIVRGVVEGTPFQLIEAVAERAAMQLLESYSTIQEVTVRLTKPNPPVAMPFDGVSVVITRTRQQVNQEIGS